MKTLSKITLAAAALALLGYRRCLTAQRRRQNAQSALENNRDRMSPMTLAPPSRHWWTTSQARRHLARQWQDLPRRLDCGRRRLDIDTLTGSIGALSTRGIFNV